jgi:hypothetical protein
MSLKKTITRGDSKSLFLTMLAEKKEGVTTCNPLNRTKECMSRCEKDKRDICEKDVHIENNKEFAGDTVTETKDTKPESYSKSPMPPALRSKQFRQKVRVVLNWLGLEMTVGNFRKCDKKYDFEAMYENILKRATKPEFEARCFLLDQDGDKIPRPNDHGLGYATIAVDVPGETRDKALANVPTGYKFIQWL